MRRTARIARSTLPLRELCSAVMVDDFVPRFLVSSSAPRLPFPRPSWAAALIQHTRRCAAMEAGGELYRGGSSSFLLRASNLASLSAEGDANAGDVDGKGGGGEEKGCEQDVSHKANISRGHQRF